MNELNRNQENVEGANESSNLTNENTNLTNETAGNEANARTLTNEGNDRTAEKMQNRNDLIAPTTALNTGRTADQASHFQAGLGSPNSQATTLWQTGAGE